MLIGPGLGTTVTFTLPAAGAMTAAGPPTAAQPGEPVRILVVDDDPRMLRFVRDALAKAGYAPVVTGEPEELAAIVRAERPRLVLLDLVLPDLDGIELMQQTSELSDLPVIFISAYGRDETVARALEAGAADYIVKPFSPTELVARVRAALRRHEAPERFVLGALAIDHERRRVTVAGNPVALTATEYELLRVLALDAGRVVTYETLLRRVWHEREHTPSNLVRAFVRSLRRRGRPAPRRPGVEVRPAIPHPVAEADHPGNSMRRDVTLRTTDHTASRLCIGEPGARSVVARREPHNQLLSCPVLPARVWRVRRSCSTTSAVSPNIEWVHEFGEHP